MFKILSNNSNSNFLQRIGKHSWNEKSLNLPNFQNNLSWLYATILFLNFSRAEWVFYISESVPEITAVYNKFRYQGKNTKPTVECHAPTGLNLSEFKAFRTTGFEYPQWDTTLHENGKKYNACLILSKCRYNPTPKTRIVYKWHCLVIKITDDFKVYCLTS